MPRQGGLGRGLASLIPQKQPPAPVSDEANHFDSPDFVDSSDTARLEAKQTTEIQPEPVADSAVTGVAEVPVEQIAVNPYQPRKNFDEIKLHELAESIKVYGVIQPLVVSQKGTDQYELIAGERRLQASKLAGIAKVPVIIKQVNDQEKLEMALIENIQRHDLDIIEEARSYKQLQDLFSLTQDEIAQRVGKSRSAVANILRLLSLPIEILKALQTGRITEGHARTILAISNPEKQRALFEMILKEHLTVRQVEERVKEISVNSHNRRVKEVDPEIREKEDQLATLLGTKVKIKNSSKGGQVVIDYFSPEELSELINRLAIPTE